MASAYSPQCASRAAMSRDSVAISALSAASPGAEIRGEGGQIRVSAVPPEPAGAQRGRARAMGR
eukprot:7692075-Pyramimonas_sp.AAC.1